MKNYEKQGSDFLKQTQTTFTAEFKKHDKYFPRDEEKRDIYTITLKNEKHRFQFTFGQSIACRHKKPTAYDVLACLQKYEMGTFDDFVMEFGYTMNTEQDIKEAQEIYRAVCNEYMNVCHLWTSKEIEALAEIQ